MHEVEFFGVEGVKIAEFGTLEIAKTIASRGQNNKFSLAAPGH
jgi:hypothetical protein